MVDRRSWKDVEGAFWQKALTFSSDVGSRPVTAQRGLARVVGI